MRYQVHAAGTDQEKFQKILKKYAADLTVAISDGDAFRQAKTACICLDTPMQNNPAGFVAFANYNGIFKTSCIVPMFGQNGAFSGALNCSNYTVLAK